MAHVEVAIFEGGGYAPPEFVQAFRTEISPLWAGLTSFGWVYVDRDPAELSPESPVEGGPFGERTWGELLENDYVSNPDPPTFKRYGSAADFVAEDDVLRFICSYDEDEREPVRAALEAEGFTQAAEKLATLEL